MNSNIVIKKICYVCGLDLYEYAYDPVTHISNPGVICPSCGTHYGLDDEGAGNVEVSEELIDSYESFGDVSHKAILKLLRQNWINNGMKWWSTENPFYPQPLGWNPKKQLENIPEEFK